MDQWHPPPAFLRHVVANFFYTSESWSGILLLVTLGNSNGGIQCNQLIRHFLAFNTRRWEMHRVFVCGAIQRFIGMPLETRESCSSATRIWSTAWTKDAVWCFTDLILYFSETQYLHLWHRHIVSRYEPLFNVIFFWQASGHWIQCSGAFTFFGWS